MESRWYGLLYLSAGLPTGSSHTGAIIRENGKAGSGYAEHLLLPFGNLSLDPYRGNMGTGSIDAWKLLMNVEGTPFVTVQACVEQYVPLEEFFGDGASGLDFTSVEISDADKAALGLASDPEIVDGKLRIFPLLTGSAMLTVKALAGTGNGSGISGSEFSREISILSRNTVSHNGGWL